MKQLILFLLFLLPFMVEAQEIVSQTYNIVQVDTVFVLRQTTITETTVAGILDTSSVTVRTASDSLGLYNQMYVEQFNTLNEMAGRARQANSFPRYFQTYAAYNALFTGLGVDMQSIITQELAPSFLGTYRIINDTANFIADLTVHPNSSLTNVLRLQERGGPRAYNVLVYPGQIMRINNFFPTREPAAAKTGWLMYSGFNTPNDRNLPIFRSPSAVVLPSVFDLDRDIITAVKLQ